MQNRINAFYSAQDFSVEDFDNEIWQKAEAAEINRYWSGEPAPPERTARAQIVWSDENFYARFDCRQAEPFVINPNPNPEIEATELWERDVCEIFITPNLNAPEKYFEFEIAPTGEWLDFAIHQLPQKRETDQSYNAGMQTAAQIRENSFSAIFQIEFQKAFGKRPKNDEVWRANLFRCVGAGETRGYLAWQPTLTELPAFHVPAVFGFLQFKRNF